MAIRPRDFGHDLYIISAKVKAPCHLPDAAMAAGFLNIAVKIVACEFA